MSKSYVAEIIRQRKYAIGEVWRGLDTSYAPRLVEPYSEWDGLLKGFRVPW